jgi:hypothetical protein
MMKEKICFIEKENQSLKERVELIEKELLSNKEKKLKKLDSFLEFKKYNQLASISYLQNQKWIVQKTHNGQWNCNVCTNALDFNLKKVLCL